MTTVTHEKLRSDLGAGRLAPLYFLYGPETFLRDRAVREISDAVLSTSGLREFNEHSFNLLSGDVHEALAAAEQLPLMSERRVVRITEFGKLREADEEVLIKYVSNPAESSVVIFIADEPDKRKRLIKTLLEGCVAVEFAALKDGEAKRWVRERLEELNLSAEPAVVDEFVTLVGSNMQTLNSELEKLAVAVVGAGRITLESVYELIYRSRELSNFQLGDQLVARNRKRALETLYRLLEDGVEPVMLLGLIANNYHRLAIARDLLDRGKRNEIFKHVPMPPFKRDEFLKNIQRVNAEKIAHGLKLIAAADFAIKSSRGRPKLQLEVLVCELAS